MPRNPHELSESDLLLLPVAPLWAGTREISRTYDKYKEAEQRQKEGSGQSNVEAGAERRLIICLPLSVQ